MKCCVVPSSAVVKFAPSVGTPSLTVNANTMTVYVVCAFKSSRWKVTGSSSMLLFLRFVWVTLITKVFQGSFRDRFFRYFPLYPRSRPLIWYLSTGSSWNVNSEVPVCWTLRFFGGSLGAAVRKKNERDSFIKWHKLIGSREHFNVLDLVAQHSINISVF